MAFGSQVPGRSPRHQSLWALSTHSAPSTWPSADVDTCSVLHLRGAGAECGGTGCLPRRLVGEAQAWAGGSVSAESSVRGWPLYAGPPLDRSVQQCPLTGSSLLGKGAQGTGLAAQTWSRPQSEGLPHCTLPLHALQGPGADVSEKNGSFTSRSGPSAGAGSCLDVTLPRCLRSHPGPQPGWRLWRLSQGPVGAPCELRVWPLPGPEALPRPCPSPQ